MIRKAGWIVECDTCQGEIMSDHPSASVVRVEIRESGWRRSKGKDLCPDCAPMKPRQNLEGMGRSVGKRGGGAANSRSLRNGTP